MREKIFSAQYDELNKRNENLHTQDSHQFTTNTVTTSTVLGVEKSM